jgi:hypothetical protein
MKTILILLLGAGFLAAQELPLANAGTVAEPLLFVIEQEEPDAAEVVAEALMEGANVGLADRVARMKNLWETLWENPRATPAEILAALGPKAKRLFQAAGQARADLEVMAGLAGKTTVELLGDAKYLTPKFPVTFHSDGTVTLQ